MFLYHQTVTAAITAVHNLGARDFIDVDTEPAAPSPKSLGPDWGRQGVSR